MRYNHNSTENTIYKLFVLTFTLRSHTIIDTWPQRKSPIALEFEPSSLRCDLGRRFLAPFRPRPFIFLTSFRAWSSIPSGDLNHQTSRCLQPQKPNMYRTKMPIRFSVLIWFQGFLNNVNRSCIYIYSYITTIHTQMKRNPHADEEDFSVIRMLHNILTFINEVSLSYLCNNPVHAHALSPLFPNRFSCLNTIQNVGFQIHKVWIESA